METLSFAFGMLAMVAVVLIAVVVVGMLKVQKMKETIANIERYLDNTNREVHDRIDHTISDLQHCISDDRRELNLRIDSLNSYVDSRFDKMENKFNGNSAKKQIIND